MLFDQIRGLPFANKYNEETNVATLMADIFANELLFIAERGFGGNVHIY